MRGAWQTLAPSAIAFADTEPAPKEMDGADIRQCISDFTRCSRKGMKAGFQK
jgi:2,4-dienoyl-CoA reductase-like NADH-dependent reductase (Old Yellow Enzyme family)